MTNPRLDPRHLLSIEVTDPCLTMTLTMTTTAKMAANAQSRVQPSVLGRLLQRRLLLVSALALLLLVQLQVERSLACKQQQPVGLQVVGLQREEQQQPSRASPWVVSAGQ